MKIEGTHKAFSHLVTMPGISNDLGIARSTVSIWKKRIESKKQYPTEKTMRKFLKKAGARILKEEIIWQMPQQG